MQETRPDLSVSAEGEPRKRGEKEERMPRQSGKDRFARVRELYSFDERLGSGLVYCMETSEPPPLKRAGPHKKQDLTPTLAGFDEAGRGALAGPVTVGCVHFPVLTSGSIPHSVAGQHTDRSITQSFNHSILHSLAGVDDSKRLSPARREEMYRRITEVSSWGVGWASAQEIDRLGIVPAVSLAARRAYSMMGQRVNLLLCDRGISLLGRGKSGREDNAERRTRNAGKAKTRRHVDTNWDTKSHILPSPFCIPRSAFRVSPSPCPTLPTPHELS